MEVIRLTCEALFRTKRPPGCRNPGGFAITTTREQAATQRPGALNFALAAAELAAQTRCENVVLLDLRSRSPVTEYFIIATGTSPRQMRTVVDEVRDLGKRTGFAPWQMDGYDSARWIVLDCVNVVVHVFDTDSRDFYDLELLWGDCPRIDWRKELGLPPEPEAEKKPRRTADRFAAASGMDEMEAEEEDARLEGRDLNDEEGDADIDEEAEEDNPMVIELPDESTGSNSVEFVEIDSPHKRRKRGRAVYPTPIEEPEDLTAEEDAVGRVGAAPLESLDEDDQEREAEAAADADPEAVSREDLPRRRLKSRPMGGVSASLSSTNFDEGDEEGQTGSRDRDDREQDHRDEIPEAHEAAAEAVRIGDVELTTEEPGQRARKKALKSRKDMAKPVKAAPGPVNVDKARGGVVKGKARRGGDSGVVDAPVSAKGRKPVVKMSKVAKAKPAAKKAVPAKKAAKAKAPAKKAPAKKPAAKKPAKAKPVAKKKPAAKKKR